MKLEAKLNMQVDGNMFDYKFFETLLMIDETHSQRKAAEKLGISHSVLNRRILKGEKLLGCKLVDVSKTGSNLTIFAQNLLDNYDTYQRRLHDNKTRLVVCGGHVSCEFIRELAIGYNMSNIQIIETDIDTAFNLANMGMVDILGFDDPARAYMYDLEPVALGRDYLSLVGVNVNKFNSIFDLEGLSFIEVEESAQRLAWNSLVDFGVDFDIKMTVGSFHEARRLVEDNENLYTFINNSLTYKLDNKSNILKKDTSHIISALNVKNSSLVENFLNFASHNAQKTTTRYGFKHLLDEP